MDLSLPAAFTVVFLVKLHEEYFPGVPGRTDRRGKGHLSFSTDEPGYSLDYSLSHIRLAVRRTETSLYLDALVPDGLATLLRLLDVGKLPEPQQGLQASLSEMSGGAAAALSWNEKVGGYAENWELLTRIRHYP